MGTVINLLSILMGFAPLIGWLATDCLCLLLCDLLPDHRDRRLATEAPEFPDVGYSGRYDSSHVESSWGSGSGLLSIGWIRFSRMNPSRWLRSGIAALSCIYFPMAMMAVVVLGYFGALGPHIVIPAIIRAGGLYWLGVSSRNAVYGRVLPFTGSGWESLPQWCRLGLRIHVFADGKWEDSWVIYRERREAMNWI